MYTQWILDVLVCNWLGTYLGTLELSFSVSLPLNISLSGMKTCQYFEVKVCESFLRGVTHVDPE